VQRDLLAQQARWDPPDRQGPMELSDRRDRLAQQAQRVRWDQQARCQPTMQAG
jgi:hypothetical protein